MASGLIEGAARWIVKTGWKSPAPDGLDSAEAVLRLRALHGTGDLGDYLDYHFQQEKHRNHDSRYQQAQNSPHDHPEHHPMTGSHTFKAAPEHRSLTEREIIIAGAIAYWCEGAKNKPHRRSEPGHLHE